MRRLAPLGLLVALPLAAQAPGWEERVAELAPALRACLEGRPGAMVVDTWPMDGGRAGARVRMPDGTGEDCVADAARRAVERRDPVPAGEQRAAEGIRAFMLERRCVDARRVDGPDGRELGWLAYAGCG